MKALLSLFFLICRNFLIALGVGAAAGITYLCIGDNLADLMKVLFTLPSAQELFRWVALGFFLVRLFLPFQPEDEKDVGMELAGAVILVMLPYICMGFIVTPIMLLCSLFFGETFGPWIGFLGVLLPFVGWILGIVCLCARSSKKERTQHQPIIAG
jgi:hypothetical protein